MTDQSAFEPELHEDVVYPLSFAQQRLWFLDQLEPGSAAYNLPRAVRLAGMLDVNALQKSLDVVVSRHETLRTTFSMVDGHPVQVIKPVLKIPLSCVDLNADPGDAFESALPNMLNEEAARPFDLARGPLLRAVLWRLSSEEHILLLMLHHIVSDGWSMGVLMRELSVLYAAFVEGRSSPLEALPIQYADYAVWQREQLQGPLLERQLGYWKTQLAELGPMQITTDRPRPFSQSFRGAQHHFSLPGDLTRALTELALRERVTLFMALLAAFQILMSRYSRQEDVVIGRYIKEQEKQKLR